MRDNQRMPPENLRVPLPDAYLRRCNLGAYIDAEIDKVSFGDFTDPSVEVVVKNYVKQGNKHKIIKNGVGLFLYGLYGIGKTFIAAAIMKEYMRAGFSCQMIEASKLKDTLASGNGYNAVPFDDHQTMLERLRSVHLVVIDDIGKEHHGSDYTRNVFTSFVTELNTRQNTSLIITSNISPASSANGGSSEFEKIYGEAFWRLLPDITHPLHVELRPGVKRKRNEVYESNRRFLLGISD